LSGLALFAPLLAGVLVLVVLFILARRLLGLVGKVSSRRTE
jgi:hypothetical protein